MHTIAPLENINTKNMMIVKERKNDRVLGVTQDKKGIGKAKRSFN